MPVIVNEPSETVETTVIKTVEATDQEPFIPDDYEESQNRAEKPDILSEEGAKKEIIRKAMSELRKRSAAARTKRKSKQRRPAFAATCTQCLRGRIADPHRRAHPSVVCIKRFSRSLWL
ncbi:hypothetical protein TMES_20080 [Thalassospira mesophila]|uniref:Uncharacterized protein n=1 Tax=Thalassospira mesophila TaxID=1293891 RepID=A0A1Y2KVM9_9PROT|nr:hypothetical protein TMES_20080 [Thalassospira mesophila]